MREVHQQKILVLLYNKFTNDSRVLKECTSLAAAGYRVELWATYDAALPEYEVINGFEVRRKFGKPSPVVKQHEPGKLKPKPHAARAARAALRRHVGRATYQVLRGAALILRQVAPRIHDRAKARYIRLENARVQARKEAAAAQKRASLQGAPKPPRPGPPRPPAKLPAVPEFDFIHCNDLLPLPFAVEMKMRDPRIKIIYDSHEYQTESAGVTLRPDKKRQFEQLERDNIPHADQVIVVGDSIAREYERLYGLKQVHVVRNCPTLTPDQPRNEYFREKFSLADDDLIFLYQGGLVKGAAWRRRSTASCGCTRKATGATTWCSWAMATCRKTSKPRRRCIRISTFIPPSPRSAFPR
ncbi:MAG: glycosyltransferase [Proteobacteria bacterium]|nr:glycosyltransferase [Pseudomonadota bacterium]